MSYPNYRQGGGRAPQHRAQRNNQYSNFQEGNIDGTLDYSDRSDSRTSYSQGGYSQFTGAVSYKLDDDQSGYDTMQYNQSGYTMNASERTPYSRGGSSAEQYLSESGRSSNYYSYTTETDTDRDNSGRSSNYHSYTTGSKTGTYTGGSSYSSSRRSSYQQHNSAPQHNYPGQYDTSSVCPSISATTVASGGQGRCPYQIDFQVQNQGKQISASKRIIHFRFGFADATALSHGKTGMDCRGEEHDIVVTWSITGGKRSVSMDGRELQYSAGKRANASRRADILEASWRMNDHIYEMRCFAYKPAAGSPEKRNPKFRQYALTIDGRSFFELPQIFDLGLKGLTTIAAHHPPSLVHSKDPTSVSNLSNSFRSSQSNQVKNAISDRIAEQRKLLNARKQAVSNESRRRRSQKTETAPSVGKSLNSGMESMGLESAVHSSAPSELDEARNRNEAAQTQPKVNGSEKRLAQYTPGQLPRNNNSAPPKPAQHQIAQQNQYQRQQHTQYHQQQQKQPPNARPSQPPPQRQIQPQQPQNPKPYHMGQQQRQNTRPHQPIQAQQAQNPKPYHQGSQQQQHQIDFEPQQPPTYDQITRDILGSTGASTAGESSMMVRKATAAYNDGNNSELDSVGYFDSSVEDSSMVIRGQRSGGVTLDDSNKSDMESSARTGISTFVSKNTFVPQKLTNIRKPSQKKPQQPAMRQQPPQGPQTPLTRSKLGYF